MAKNIKKMKAFSLTEVLVTMFIIMLLIIATAPLVTKKNTKNAKPHGVWECKLDENGMPYSTLKIDGILVDTTEYATEYCLFEPQQSAEEYTITAIGGGGGGASASISVPDAVSYGTAVSYKIPQSGYYDVVMVGGGGGGSPKVQCTVSSFLCHFMGGSGGGKGGGAGGIKVLENQYYQKDNLYILEAGMGGEGGGNGDNHCTHSWKDENCKGQDGIASKFYKFGDDPSTVEGGKGGGKTSPGQAGNPKLFNNQSGNGMSGGKIFSYASLSSTSQKAVQLLGASIGTQLSYGDGGNGTSILYGEPGKNGIVMLKSRSFYVGGGGRQGSAAYMVFKDMKEPVRVYVGQGGAGATTENSPGESGENSSFGNYLVAKGGDGGAIKADSSTNQNTTLAGKNGSMSPYGGVLAGGNSSNLNGQNDMGTDDSIDINERGIKEATDTTYGAGGGGGAGKSRVNCDPATGYEGCWGRGGRGMPGIVHIEWN